MNMTDSTNNNPTHTAPSKKPLDPHPFVGSKGTVDDVRVQTGYPIWNLIDQWMGAGYDDNVVFEAYNDMPPEEWEAAKRYYLDHKPIIDARIIANTQPYADDDTPPFHTTEDYFAWLARNSAKENANGADQNG
jgi:uncharacterized protein (DUF433 family)